MPFYAAEYMPTTVRVRAAYMPSAEGWQELKTQGLWRQQLGDVVAWLYENAPQMTYRLEPAGLRLWGKFFTVIGDGHLWQHGTWLVVTPGTATEDGDPRYEILTVDRFAARYAPCE